MRNNSALAGAIVGFVVGSIVGLIVLDDASNGIDGAGGAQILSAMWNFGTGGAIVGALVLGLDRIATLLRTQVRMNVTQAPPSAARTEARQVARPPEEIPRESWPTDPPA